MQTHDRRTRLQTWERRRIFQRLVVFRTPILLGCGAGKGRPADLRLAARVLGDGLGALADGVLGQLSRQDEADRSLDLARAQSALLVVAAQTTSLASNALLQHETS